MADSTIWDLLALTTPALVDLLPIVDDPSGTPITKKLTLTSLRTLTLTNVVVQIKTVGSGTYTPTSGMRYVLGILQGAGAGGEGGAATDSAGGGGGGGGTCIRLMTAAEIGASQPYVVAAGSAAGVNAAISTFGSAGALMTANGGSGGFAGSQAGALGGYSQGGTGGTGVNGHLNIRGQPGGPGITFSGTAGMGGRGGWSFLGNGGPQSAIDTAGVIGSGYGGGGSGGHAATTSNRDGGAGAGGILYLIEFI